MQAAAAYPSMRMVRAPEYHCDEATERREYSLSLLPEAEQDKYLKEDLTPQDVVGLICRNTAACLMSGKNFRLSGDMVGYIDQRVRKPVFIVDSTRVYTEEELLRTYPFKELGTTPKRVFAQQEIGIFPARYSTNPDEREYQVRDLGEDEEFVAIEDFVGQLTHVNYYKKRREMIKSVKTKVFIAREAWTDFLELTKQVRIFARFGADAARQARQTGGHNFMSLMLRAMSGAEPMALENMQQIEERLEREKAEHERRERDLRAREEALARETERLIEMLEKMQPPAGDQ